jgi:hypothetical protein
MLASIDDVNAFLPSDKFKATDGNPDIALFQTDVERLIKGYLSSAYSSSTLAGWAAPSSTPGLIRSIAGRLIAAFYYAKKASEDIPDWDGTYPQLIYNEAMALLEKIRTGELTLIEVPEGEQPETVFDSDFFWPRAGSTPKFEMDMQW